MKEFWLWVVIVSLIIFCIMGLSFLALYQTTQVKEVKAILIRLEDKERKEKLLTPKEE